MRSKWTKGLVLAVGLMAGAAQAQEGAAPIVAIGRPMPLARTAPAATPTTPAAFISRPVPLKPRPLEQVERASFVGERRTVVRGVSPDPVPHYAPGDLRGWTRPPAPGTTPVAYSPSPGLSSLPDLPGGPPLPGGPLVPEGPIVSGPPVVGPPVAGVPAPPIATTPGGAALAMPVDPNCVCPPGGPCPPACAAGCPCPPGCASGDCGCIVPGSVIDGGWPTNRWWLSAEYLLWWAKGDKTPPLVATEDFNTAPAGGQFAGILPPLSNAQVAYGDNALGERARSGLRLFGGCWFNDEHTWGLEVGGFFLAEQQDRFTASSPGNPVIRRPIISQTPSAGAPFPGDPDGEIVASPASLNGPVAGTVSVLHRSALWGYETNLKRGLFCGESFNIDGLIGFRAVSLDESLAINENLTLLAPPPTFGGVNGILVNDKFSTSNRFYGGQVGLQGELWLLDRLSVAMSTKVALGTTWQRVNVEGSSTAQVNGTPIVTLPGGLLALPTNIGQRTQNAFTVVPEVGLTLNYQPANWIRLSAGYNFLYWSSVVRPGAQIDPNVNRTFQPFSPVPPTGPAVPAPRLETSDFWVHGLTLGLEFRY